jgi:predicted nucleic acid-binding protein
MRIALEMNVLTYAEAMNGAAMRDKALDLIRPLPQDSIVVHIQAWGELYKRACEEGGAGAGPVVTLVEVMRQRRRSER